MSKLSDALAVSRDAFVAMGDAPSFSIERGKAIAKFYASNIALAKALKGISVDEAKATYEEFFGGQSGPSFDDVASGGSSTARDPDEIITDTDIERAGGTVEPGGYGRRRRSKRHRDDCGCARCYARDRDIFDVLGVR